MEMLKKLYIFFNIYLKVLKFFIEIKIIFFVRIVLKFVLYIFFLIEILYGLRKIFNKIILDYLFKMKDDILDYD